MPSEGRKPFQASLHFLVGLLQRRQRSPQFRILICGSSLNFRKRGYRLRHLQIIHYREIFVEVRKHQNRELEPAAIHLQFRFLQVSLLLVGLNLRLDDVRVSDFASVLQLLTNVEEPLRLGRGLLLG